NRDDQFVVSGDVRLYDNDHTYTWRTTHSDYTAVWSGHLTAGSAQFTVKDALGQPVYSHTFAARSDSSGSEPAQGTLPGSWTVQVTFKGATGSLSFVVQ